MSQSAHEPEAAAVLDFWFGPLEDGWVDEAQRSKWFSVDPDFDELIRRQFEPLLQRAADGNLDHWLRSPLDTLAFIVLCDQFPRNLYREHAHAFAWDATARDAARHFVRQRLHIEVPLEQRAFGYLPFEHSEDILDQYLSVALFTELRDATPSGMRHLTGNTLRYAQRHFDVIVRFGRFPHRNAALSRHTSAAEATYLAEGGGF